MPVVEARFEGLEFPPCCCGCGSRGFKWRAHTEKVVVWTVISVTRYRMITLQIPGCDDCVRRPWYWYGAAAAVLGLAYVYAVHLARPDHEFGLGIFLVMMTGIGLVLKGLASRPLRILGFDNDDRMIKLKIRGEDMVRKLLALRGNYESEHRLVRKGWLIALGVVTLPFLVILVSAIGRHRGH